MSEVVFTRSNTGSGLHSKYVHSGEVAGVGSSKTVYKAFDTEEGLAVAWNEISLKDEEENSTLYESLITEVNILTALDNPHIVKLYDSWLDKQENCLVFITEFLAGGTLKKLIKRSTEAHGKPSSLIMKKWAFQILIALEYIHQQKIIHRDIKFENVFIGNNGEVKVGDLGLAKVVRDHEEAYSFVGTPSFMAPEFYNEGDSAVYDNKVDIWAYGMTLVEIGSGEYPFSECKNKGQIFTKVSSGHMPEIQIAKVEDKEMLSLIRRCLQPRDSRPSAKELLEDLYFADNIRKEHILTFKLWVYYDENSDMIEFNFDMGQDVALADATELVEGLGLNLEPATIADEITNHVSRVREAQKGEEYRYEIDNFIKIEMKQNELRNASNLDVVRFAATRVPSTQKLKRFIEKGLTSNIRSSTKRALFFSHDNLSDTLEFSDGEFDDSSLEFAEEENNNTFSVVDSEPLASKVSLDKGLKSLTNSLDEGLSLDPPVEEKKEEVKEVPDINSLFDKYLGLFAKEKPKENETKQSHNIGDDQSEGPASSGVENGSTNQE